MRWEIDAVRSEFEGRFRAFRRDKRFCMSNGTKRTRETIRVYIFFTNWRFQRNIEALDLELYRRFVPDR